jgi:hypothetical protein
VSPCRSWDPFQSKKKHMDLAQAKSYLRAFRILLLLVAFAFIPENLFFGHVWLSLSKVLSKCWHLRKAMFGNGSSAGLVLERDVFSVVVFSVAIRRHPFPYIVNWPSNFAIKVPAILQVRQNLHRSHTCRSPHPRQAWPLVGVEGIPFTPPVCSAWRPGRPRFPVVLLCIASWLFSEACLEPYRLHPWIGAKEDEFGAVDLVGKVYGLSTEADGNVKIKIIGNTGACLMLCEVVAGME